MTKKPKVPKAMVVHNKSKSLWHRTFTFVAHKIKAVLNTIKKEKTLEEIEIENESYCLLGDAYLKDGQPNGAIKAYKRASVTNVSTDKFNECGNLCMKKAKKAKEKSNSLPLIEQAITSFRITKNKEKLIECGQLLVKKGYRDEAIKCFAIAISIPSQDNLS